MTVTTNKTLKLSLWAAGVCGVGLFLLPNEALAKKPGVLEGKPVVVDRLELRKLRFQITPAVGMSLSQPFVHKGLVGANLRFDFTDWIGVRASFMYGVMPNTRVRPEAALVGGAVAALLWQLAGTAFAAFVAGSTRYTAIYSGFAALVVFLIWLYVAWLIVLIGGQVAYFHQHPTSYLAVRTPPGVALREGIALGAPFRRRLHAHEPSAGRQGQRHATHPDRSGPGVAGLDGRARQLARQAPLPLALHEPRHAAHSTCDDRPEGL